MNISHLSRNTMNTTILPFDTNKVIEICRRSDVVMLGVFGSVVRGEATEQSDVDLLVRFSKPKSLLGVADLAIQIETTIGKRVDLFTEAAISPYIRDQVKRELKVIYEA
jgi:predicted nucleotidyltransferase